MSSTTTRGAKTRTRILAEARRALVESGYEGLVMREVAARSGVRLGNLQYYFPTREALVGAVIEAEAGADLDTIRGAQVSGSTSPGGGLRQIVTELVTRWRGDSAAIFSTLNLLSLQNGYFKALYRSIYTNYYAALEEAIACVVPGLTDDEYAMRARLLSALIDGTPYQVSVGRKSAFLARVVDQACDIATRPSGTADPAPD